MSEQGQKKNKRPQFYKGVRVRMPQNYDFNTWGKNFAQYRPNFRLRTDAVWEKYQLKDWFRLTNKLFVFDKSSLSFKYLEPDDIYSMILEPWGFDEEQYDEWTGNTPTGVTNAFQVSKGPSSKFQNTFNSFYSMPDYYLMCAMRFDKWWKCDHVFSRDRYKYDYNPQKGLRNMKESDHYPCFREYYEADYACADNIMEFLTQLAFRKQADNHWEDQVSNLEAQSLPTIYDSPQAPERTTYTY